MKLEFRRRRRRYRETNETAVALLASIHRHYLFMTIFPVSIISFIIWKDSAVTMIIIGTLLLPYGIWTFLARLFEWKHFYCSCQLSARNPMTPCDIRFEELSPLDGYFDGVITFIGGIIFILIAIF